MELKLKTLLIDGEPMALDKIRDYIGKVEGLEIVKECKDAAEALSYMKDNAVDVIFTEIAMPGNSNGIELVEQMQTRPIVVYVSANKEYAVEAFRLGAVDYLHKPYGMPEFQRALDRVTDAYRRRTALPEATEEAPRHIFIRNGKEYERVLIDDIIYISSEAEYLAFHIRNYEKPLREKNSFAEIMCLLPNDFVQVHRSSIINLSHLKSVGSLHVIMNNGDKVSVSKANRQMLRTILASTAVRQPSFATRLRSEQAAAEEYDD